jgi:hypothetical protein
LEQKRALGGNPVPQLVQKTGIVDPLRKISAHMKIRRRGGGGSLVGVSRAAVLKGHGLAAEGMGEFG